MKVVYIAGPFRAPNAWERENNIREAETLGFEVAKLGAMPDIPHAGTRFFDGTLTPEFWLAGTLEKMRRCDAVLLTPRWRESEGACMEVDEAERLEMPIFDNLDDLQEWLKSEGKSRE